MKKVNFLNDLGILLIRLVLGVVFVFHGSQKMFGLFEGSGIVGFAKYLESIGVDYPAYAAVLAGGAEFVGGLALITGLGMRMMTVPLMITMVIAGYLAHARTFALQQNGIEFPLTLGVVLAGLLFMGPGRFRVPDFTTMLGNAELPEIGGARSQPQTSKAAPAPTMQSTVQSSVQPKKAEIRPNRPITRKTSPGVDRQPIGQIIAEG